MLYARALFFSGAPRRWRLRAATGAPEVSFVHCYRLAWSRFWMLKRRAGAGLKKASLRRRGRCIAYLEVWHAIRSHRGA